jgi:predicted P-loop ATPase
MLVGSDLIERDYQDLGTRWIDRTWAQLAKLRRVNHLEGKDLVGGNRGDYSAIAIPYYRPGQPYEVTWRLRRDNPEIDARTHKPKGKYVAAPGDRNHAYFPPLVELSHFEDVSLPIVIVEGELKAIAMRRLASHDSPLPRFLVMALSGIWNWRGTIGAENNANGVRVPVKGPIPDLDLLKWLLRNVIIAFDSDSATNQDIRRARHALSLELRGRGANLGYLEWPPEQGKGPDDWIMNAGPSVVLNAISRVQFNTAAGWQSKLLCTDTGKPKPLVENARIALENVPEFSGLALDEFSGRIARPPAAPWPKASDDWSDVDSIEFSAYLQRNHIDMRKETAADAVQMVASRNKFHPVRQYLDGLAWDGVPRVDNWLTRYVGVKFDNYSSAAGRCWLISAVARIFEPGCKADMALLLIGPEGKRKSTVCSILGEPYFSDNIPEDLGQKDAQLHVAGHWIMELPELATLNKTELTTIKAWMSRSEDIFRPPYGRQIVHRKRQCVFIATSNQGEPLKDTTGNRRFLPVETGEIDTDLLAAERDQLWAEAVELYKSGAPWWFTDEMIIAAAKQAQSSRVDLHVWYEPIRKWCEGQEFVTVLQILDNCIRKEQGSRTQADKINVVRCLQAMGWRLTQRRLNGVPTKVYLNPDMLE